MDVEIESLAPKGNILCITDPSGARIFLDGVNQGVETSTLLKRINAGKHLISFVKPGYRTYTTKVYVEKRKTVTVATILSQIVEIVDKGIVVCTGPNTGSCNDSMPLTCPSVILPTDYINIAAILDSVRKIKVIVRFIYSIDNIEHYIDVNIKIKRGLNTVYAFPANTQYPPDSILLLKNVILI